jgi:hypothetical protein
MANHPITVNTAEIINVHNIPVVELQGKLRDHIGELPTNDSITLQ